MLGFGSDLASLQAKPAIDAMRSVAMRSRQNRDRPTGNGSDTEVRAAANQHIANAAQWMRPIRMTMRIAPGKPGRAGNRNFPLQQLVVRLQVPIGDGPVGADPIFGVDAKVGGMKARRESSPVNRASAHAFAAVIRAERERMRSAGDTQIVPIELVRAFFVADPVLLRIPERTCFQRDHTKPRPRQTLHQHPACASHARRCNSQRSHFPEIDASAMEASAWSRDGAAISDFLHGRAVIRCSGGAPSSSNWDRESTGAFHS